MKIIQAVAPIIEPISLDKLKLHLRLSSGSFDDNLTLTQCFGFGSHAIDAGYTTHIGTSVAVAGKQVEVLLSCGTNQATGVNDTRIEESDDNITFTAWTGGAFGTVTTANDNADYKLPYKGVKQYIRTASRVLLAACEFGTSIMTNEATTAEDDLLTDIIQSAREHVEDITGRQLLSATWDYYLDDFPSGNSIKIPFGNLQTVTSIKYTDSDSTETTMTVATEYIVETNGNQCGRIVLPYSVTWPSFTAYSSNPIVVRFVAGWTTAALIPSEIRAAILLICADLYTNREGQVFSIGGSGFRENEAVQRLLDSVRLHDRFDE